MKRGMVALVLLVLLSLVLSGCGGDDEPETTGPAPECAINEDCPGTEVCDMPVCRSGKCAVEFKESCCGNLNCEEGEDRCNCPSDCGGDEGSETCSGLVEFTTPAGVKQKAKYFEFGCIKSSCTITYDPSDINPNSAYYDLRQDTLVVGMTVSHIQPFEITHGTLDVELQMKDFNIDRVTLPVTVSEIRVMEGATLLGRVRNIGYKLNFIGSSYSVKVPISYSMAIPEEPKTVTIQVDYRVMKVKKVMVLEGGKAVRDENGQYVYTRVNDTMKIDTFRQSLAERIYFIDPNYDQVKVDFSQE